MRGKHQKAGRHVTAARKKTTVKRGFPVLIACIILSVASFGGTLAYILTNTESLENSFEPAQVSCEVLEDPFNGVNKNNVRVQNTGNTSVYIRVKLLPYYYDRTDDTIIAKDAWEPSFTSETDWVKGADGFYYYTSPVAPGASTTALIPSLTLEQDDVSLARQVLEIIASCIQAEPDAAVLAAWTNPNGSVTAVGSDNKLTVTGG